MWNPFGRKDEDPADMAGPQRIHYQHPQAREKLAVALRQNFLKRYKSALSPVILLCIGTDRSTGDCLGPLIGSKLQQRELPIVVCGTLDEPVHAVNLQETLDNLNGRFEDPFILAIDACLGRTESVGYISIKDGPLSPGTGVNKSLPAAGNFHIIGIVNVGGFMEYLVLQNTRLSLVMSMADLIADSIEKCLRELPLAAVPPAKAEGGGDNASADARIIRNEALTY
jgi:putative sporulation protein YyaC